MPLIASGVVTINSTVTANVCVADVPQPLVTEIETSPLVVPVIAEIVFDEELPDHPLGSIQLYEVAPLTGEIL